MDQRILFAEPDVLMIKTEPTTPKRLEFKPVRPSPLPVGTDSTVLGKTLCLKHLP